MPRCRKKQTKEEPIRLRRENWKLDPTPFVAILNIISKGLYLKFGRGFVVGKKLPKIYNEEVPVNKLREIRKGKGLSQLRLSFMTDISPWDISRIENGWIKPYPGWRRRLSRALGTPESELFPSNGEERVS